MISGAAALAINWGGSVSQENELKFVYGFAALPGKVNRIVVENWVTL
jgi:hypothetical protein